MWIRALTEVDPFTEPVFKMQVGQLSFFYLLTWSLEPSLVVEYEFDLTTRMLCFAKVEVETFQD